MDEKNIKLVLSYDGSGYHGWQRQNNAITVQGVIEEKIHLMLGEAVALIASGRTDAGVHAIQQVCNFKTVSDISPAEILRGLNSLLPDDILVKRAEYVSLEFHARYSAKKKAYEYRILNREEPDVFLRNYIWHIRRPLNTEDMSRCLSLLEGRHDFSAFRSSGSGNRDPFRSVSMASLYSLEGGVLRICLQADGFLRHMVRNIVGTVVDAGLGKTTPMEFKEILASGERRLAGVKAPSRGLFLVQVEY